MSQDHNQRIRSDMGRFISSKQYKKRLRMIKGIRKKSPLPVENSNPEKPKKYEGRRIVELDVLGENLKCSYKECGSILSLEDGGDEKRFALVSIIPVQCRMCKRITEVPTGKFHDVPADLTNGKSVTHGDVNDMAVLGSIELGIGCTDINRFMAILNIPGISPNLYSKYLESVGTAINKVAEATCATARQEERKLVIEKMKELCQELPPEVSQEIYPEMTAAIKSQEDFTESSTFDANLLEIVNIIVSFDMGWSKRGSGHSYDSLNGYGALIGFLTGRVLDYTTKNRKCWQCEKGKAKNEHICHLNYTGTAKSMEADAAADLVNNSSGLKEAGLKVRVFIGDDDSSAIDRIRKGNANKIFKFSDPNHLNKNYGKQLYNIRSSGKYPELKKKGVIKHIIKLFTYAVAQNKKNSNGLAATLRSIPDHLFGKHQNCSSWCSSSSAPKINVATRFHSVIFECPNLHSVLKKLFDTYAANAHKFCITARSQRNEALNNVITHFYPKNRFYAGSKQGNIRIDAGVMHFNEGNLSVIKTKKLMGISPGKHTEKFAKKKDDYRKAEAARRSTKESKAKRCLNTVNREQKRIIGERQEGPTYSSNQGINCNPTAEAKEGPSCSSNPAIDCNVDEPKDDLNYNELSTYEKIRKLKDDLIIVYYDFETSGLDNKADILQIAAKAGASQFSIYITPTKNIDADASLATGLTNKGPKLYYKNREVTTVPLTEAFQAFFEFLCTLKHPSILIAHNGGRFDHPLLLRAIQTTGSMNNFKGKIYGFADSVIMFRRVFPDRKGPNMFKLSFLAADFLHIRGDFHEAMFDVLILEKLCNKFISDEDVKKALKTFKSSLENEEKLQFINSKMPDMTTMKKLTSAAVCKKMIMAGIAYADLKNIFDTKGKQMLIEYLTEKCGRAVRVTKNEKYIESIIKHFSNII